MTRCLDEGKLQSYFDGELSIEMMESVTSHLAACVTCAAAAQVAHDARCDVTLSIISRESSPSK